MAVISSALPIAAAATAALLPLPVSVLGSVAEAVLLIATVKAERTLTNLEDSLVIVNQVGQFIGQLERHRLQTGRLCPVHHNTLGRFVQRSLKNSVK